MIDIWLITISYIAYTLRDVLSSIYKMLLYYISFRCTVTSRNREGYIALEEYLQSLQLKELQNNIHAEIIYGENGDRQLFSIDYGSYVCFIKWNCIMVIEKSQLENKFEILNSLTIRLFGKYDALKAQILKQFSIVGHHDELCTYPLSDIYTKYYVPKKYFSDVFTQSSNRIIQHLEQWLKNKDKYRNCGVIHKTGILLYGDPGTGKSSLIRAIATYLKYQIHMIDARSYKDGQLLIERILKIPKKSIIVFEDIDCVLEKRENTEDSSDRNLLGVILNILDGVISPEDVIFIATTNYLDRLDNALIRYGRFDLKIHCDNLDRELAIKMCQHYRCSVSVLENEVMPINPAYRQTKILQQICQNQAR